MGVLHPNCEAGGALFEGLIDCPTNEAGEEDSIENLHLKN
jgi:hypothetical protein